MCMLAPSAPPGHAPFLPGPQAPHLTHHNTSKNVLNITYLLSPFFLARRPPS